MKGPSVKGNARPQLGESLGTAWGAPIPPVHHRLAFISPESQGAGWQDLPQQPRRLVGGPAEAHVGVGPWGLQAHRDRGPQTQQQATRWEWVPVGAPLGDAATPAAPRPAPALQQSRLRDLLFHPVVNSQGYGRTNRPGFSGFAGLRLIPL